MMNNELKMQNEKSIPKGFKLTEMGVIPEDWCCIQAKELINFLGGFAFSSKSAKDSGVRWLKIANVGLNEIKWDAEAFLPQSYLSTYQDYELKHGDVVMALTRPILGGRLKIAQLKKSDVPSLLNQRVAKLTPKIEGGLPFIYHLVQSSDFIAAMNLAMAGSDPPNIGAHSLGEILIRAPFAVKEQAAIADILSDTDILITEIEQLIAKKKDIKTATMQQLLTGRTRLPQFSKYPDGTVKGYKTSEQGKIPEDWDYVTIGEFTDCTAGGTPLTSNQSYWGGTNPWMSSGELHLRQVYDVAERITDEGLASSSTKYIPKNSVLIGLAGQGKTRGTVAIARISLCTNQSIAAVFPSNRHSAEYLYYNLDSRYEELRSLSTGDGGRGGLNLKIIKELLIPFPNLHEQTAIATILSDMDAELTGMEQKLAKVRDIKQGMVQQLLTGRIRVPLDRQP